VPLVAVPGRRTLSGNHPHHPKEGRSTGYGIATESVAVRLKAHRQRGVYGAACWWPGNALHMFDGGKPSGSYADPKEEWNSCWGRSVCWVDTSAER
jgi:hypothetical protein